MRLVGAWTGLYTFFKNDDDGNVVFRNPLFPYIKIVNDGTNIMFRSWCQFNSKGDDCSDDVTSLGTQPNL